ncbi:SHOCT domain-containing protein [Nocardia sp. NPDC057030]|uniref:SHOCT domain-containing protein n=1 Tax=unclassified Nocardia TaxID=2637762 RepID=UPI003644F4AF
MMYWYGDGAQWWLFVLLILVVVPLWVTAAVAIIAFNRLDRVAAQPRREQPRLSPEALLAELFASGEVDETEYRHRLAVLRPMSAKPVGTQP